MRVSVKFAELSGFANTWPVLGRGCQRFTNKRPYCATRWGTYIYYNWVCTVWVEVTHSLFLSFTSAFSCHTGSESRSRLRGLLTLRLSGLDVSDSTLKMIVRHMPSLRRLDLSHCQGLTDQSINLLTATGCNTRNTLRQLNLSGTWSLKIPLIFDPTFCCYPCGANTTRQITCDWCCKNKVLLMS